MASAKKIRKAWKHSKHNHSPYDLAMQLRMFLGKFDTRSLVKITLPKSPERNVVIEIAHKNGWEVRWI